jgi:Concanavalin A-like lectin/glucanases superfamily
VSGPRASSLCGLILGLLAAGACTPAPIEVLEIDPATLDDGLVAHWTFDEGSGAVALDHSGNGHDAQITGGTWLAAGHFGGALHLDEGAFVSVADFPSAASSWSVSAWVRLTDATPSTEAYKTVISTESLGVGGWEMNIDRTMPQPGAHFGYWEGSAAANYYRLTCTCMAFGEWTHIAASVDAAAGTLSVYVGGVLGASMPITHTILPGSATLYMGRWSGDGRLLVGDLDDILIYGRVLFPAEVAELSLASPPDVP